ncbi:MAG TPA: alpha/beta fold hydrolase [Actinomycetota bacterium]|nr:alpha/beta fold hydrolase [Actinomycetota bacterium]
MAALARSRSYAVPARAFEATTADGVTLRGHQLGEGDPAVIFCHGFFGWHRKPRLVRFQEELAKRFTVFAFDFRGHGSSEGFSTYGSQEHLDVDAVVRRAREAGFDRVVTLGGSMGGIAVIRHAALMKGVDAVVAVSTPALWDGHDSNPIRRIIWSLATPSGRSLLRAFGVRVAPVWEPAEAPAELVRHISPTPLVIIHGRDDHFFDDEQAWLLYRMAGPPKRLLLGAPFGHAEDGYNPSFAQLVGDAIVRALG